MFRHKMGIEVVTKVTHFRGIITSRSENLYGCNRYYIQPKADSGMKIPDGWWVDEDDVSKYGDGVFAKPKKTGAPMNKIC